MTYQLGARSLKNLEGVHPDLVRVVHRAIELTNQDFTVVEGLRTKERQAQLLKQGVTKTMNSRHITGHAVDIYPWLNGKVDVNADESYFLEIAESMRKASLELKVPLVWGYAWDGTMASYKHMREGIDQYVKRKRAARQRPFVDMPHYELFRGVYK